MSSPKKKLRLPGISIAAKLRLVSPTAIVGMTRTPCED